jgi:hypothetical protein
MPGRPGQRGLACHRRPPVIVELRGPAIIGPMVQIRGPQALDPNVVPEAVADVTSLTASWAFF